MPNQAQNIDQLNTEINKLRTELGKKIESPFKADELQKAQEALKGLQATQAEVNTTFSDLTSILRANLAEMSKQNSALSISKKGYQGLTSVVEKLKNEEAGVYGFNTKQLKALQEKAKIGFDDLRRNVQALTAEERRSEAGQAMLKARRAGYAIEKEALKEIEKRLELEQKVEKTVGATGALLTSTNKLLSSLGFGHMSSEIDELNTKLKDELREEIKKAGDDVNTVALKFKYMGKAAAGAAKIFADGLTEPEFVIGKIFDTYLKINKASVDAIHLTGQNAVAAASWGANYASAVDYLETINELTKQTGMNAQNIFSEKVIGQAAALKTTMGLTAQEAGGLAVMAQTTGREVNNIVDSVVATTSAFNGANRAAVSQGVVLREVANASNSIKLSLANNPEALTKAAAAATRLGLSLQDVDNIAASLTDFQTSISNELEAELLIGKDLNLEKARELALNNDLAGLSDELFKNSADINEFGKLNRIQQEAYAKSLGMTKDQLAKIAYNKSLELGMTEEQAEAAAGVEASEMKRIAAQENFAKALEKISGALAPILDIVGDILSMPLAPYILLGFAAVAKLGGSIQGVGKAFGGMYKAGKEAMAGVAGLFKKGALTSAIEKFKGAFGEGAGDMVKSKSGKMYSKDSPQGKMISNLSGKADKAGDVATDAQEQVGSKSKGGFKEAMKDVAGGLKAMGAKGVFQGIINLALAGPALVLAVASIPFLLTVAAIGKAAGVGLRGLASGLKALGKAGVEGFIGVGLIAALGVAMIPFGYALGLAAPAIEAFGTVITSVFSGLATLVGAVAEGFVTMMGAVSMETIGPMLLLGPALFGIAAGLAAIAIAGPMAIPALLAVTGLAAVAGGVATIFGAGESKSAGEAKGKSDEGSLAAVEKKLDDLISAVRAGGNVYMDSNKVGKAQVMGSYKSA